MSLHAPLKHLPAPPEAPLLSAFLNAIETEDEAAFLAASDSGLFEAVVPEWTRMRGHFKTQHRNHHFALDVHSAKVVIKTRQTDRFQALSPHWQRLVTLAAFFHDVEKCGGPLAIRPTLHPDHQHPLKGAAVVRRMLPVFGFSAVETFVVAELVLHHQLFGRMIILHDKRGHAPTRETYQAHARIFPSAAFLDALLPLTEGDIRAVKEDDAIFSEAVAEKLTRYSEGVRAEMLKINAQQAEWISGNRFPVFEDERTQLEMLPLQLPEQLAVLNACGCGLEPQNNETPFTLPLAENAATANGLAFAAFLEGIEVQPSAPWVVVRNPLKAWS